MADDALPELGDMIFSVVIGYLGALEFIYLVRHLYHWSCGHAAEPADAESLHRLQQNMRNELSEATAREQRAGAKAMQDGVLYKDGFRLDPQQAEKEQRRKQLEAELQEKKRIEEETRKQLEAAEAQLAQQREEAAENARKLLEAERAREEQQRRAEEEAENARRLAAAEEEAHRKQRAAEAEAEAEEAAESERRLFDAERAREEAESAAAQSRALIEAEREREHKQRLIEENARKFLEAEEEMVQMLERQQHSAQLESAPQTPVVEEPCVRRTFTPLSTRVAADESGDDNENDDNNNNNNNNNNNERLTQTVKTQFGQTINEPYSRTTKPLLFPGISDEGSSVEPFSSSFSTQPSDEVATGAEDANRTAAYPPQVERQEPDGEDTGEPGAQYTDDYLRSLDGIKHRPLVREDGSGRRRAFKKRRSSGSSTSSRESRASREEELRMFTSLEEEELKAPQEGGDVDFTPIKYTSEPTLKVKGHHRRHKRSPAKDVKSPDSSVRGSLEMLGEENTDPWGEVVPEHYKDTAFWKREKAMSIDEEELEFDRSAAAPTHQSADEEATNMPKASSFEDASHTQNKEAITSLQKHYSKDEEPEDSSQDTKDDSTRSDTKSNLQTSQNAESNTAQRSSVSPRLRRSPRIDEMDQYEERWRETAETTTKVNTPSISVQHSPDVAPWRDEHGLLMEGLSDFYDFTASVNPSRSRSTSRNPSPANTAPSTPLPRDVAFDGKHGNADGTIEVYDDTGNLEENEFRRENVINFIESLTNGNQLSRSRSRSPSPAVGTLDSCRTELRLQNVADAPNRAESDLEEMDGTHVGNEMNLLVQTLRAERGRSCSRSRSPLPTMDNIERSLETRRQKRIKHNDELLEKLAIPKEPDVRCSTDEEASPENVQSMVESLRLAQASSSSRSRSRSPLPTADNLERSLEARRNRLIKHNDELFEKLHMTDERDISPTQSPGQSPTASPCQLDLSSSADDCTREQMHLLVESLRSERSRSRSRSPLPTSENIERSLETRRSKLIQRNDEVFEKLLEDSSSKTEQNMLIAPIISIEISADNEEAHGAACGREEMSSLVEALRLRRSRSKSPMRQTERGKTPEPLTAFAKDAEAEREQRSRSPSRSQSASPGRLSPPQIVLETVDDQQMAAADDCSAEQMSSLVEALRLRRSRSRTPLSGATERARTPEPGALAAAVDAQQVDEREMRSRSPSRSQSTSPGRMMPAQAAVEATEEYIVISEMITDETHIAELSDYYDFHMMLNLEASQNRTLTKKSEEYESMLAAKERQVDEDALRKLNNAVEEIELRTVTPIEVASSSEETDLLSDLHGQERLRQLRCSPTTPDYERTLSSEWLDTQRIKQDTLTGGFKRSTYVGESMDIGGELEQLRQRSRSPSPKFDAAHLSALRQSAAQRREVQDRILAELTAASQNASPHDADRHGAKPKTERKSSTDVERTLSKEVLDTQRIKEEMLAGGFQRSTYVGESVDMGSQLEELRRETAEFRRSRSKSRSPLDEHECWEVAQIEREAAKRELKDKLLDELQAGAAQYKDFTQNLNADFLDSNRRASDSLLLMDFDLDPEDYHHFRRFSLNQEQPVEEYPNDDYLCISQIEVRTPSGTRTWLREDYYSDEFQNLPLELDAVDVEAVAVDVTDELDEEDVEQAQGREEDESEGSEDDRRTVVDVEDEIDEDICDFNERGPADESHHEISECEEAEREMDRYAGRGANDWREVGDIDELLSPEVTVPGEEGAVGGLTATVNSTPYDSDSFAIDQIYDEAIKNRKQSGILRDFDSILQEMQDNYLDKSETDSTSDSDRYALWAKTRNLEKSKSKRGVDPSLKLIENERRDHEMRYLGDANVEARQAARLRSRYGYVPVLQSNAVEDIEVDLSYKPRREYNWRKNFKLDEEETHDTSENADGEYEEDTCTTNGQYMDLRRYSLGGESITLFSRSPEKDKLGEVPEEEQHRAEEAVRENLNVEIPNDIVEKADKPKKKKSKKKLQKKSSLEKATAKDEEDSENQIYSRRSSSIHMETDSPKRKSRSRKSSRSSLNNDESTAAALLSPRCSIDYAEPISDIMEEYSEVTPPQKKKTKKRKKVKELSGAEPTAASVNAVDDGQTLWSEPVEAVSAIISPATATINMLSTLSPNDSICVTPASTESEKSQWAPVTTVITTKNTVGVTNTASNTTTVDTFDILKDANFYPLF